MSATLIPHSVSLPRGVIGDSRIAHQVAPEQLRIRNGIYSLARFQLLDGRRVFVVTELAENAGPPVSDAAEIIATVVLARFGADLAPEQAVFVEHFDDCVAYVSPARSGRRARVTFDQWLITWRDRRAVFVDWVPLYTAAVH